MQTRSVTLWIAPMRMSQQGRMLVQSYTAFTEVGHFLTTAHAYCMSKSLGLHRSYRPYTQADRPNLGHGT